MPSRLRIWEMIEIRAGTDQPLGTARDGSRRRGASIIQIIRIATGLPPLGAGWTVDGATLVDGLWLASRDVV